MLRPTLTFSYPLGVPCAYLWGRRWWPTRLVHIDQNRREFGIANSHDEVVTVGRCLLGVISSGNLTPEGFTDVKAPTYVLAPVVF